MLLDERNLDEKLWCKITYFLPLAIYEVENFGKIFSRYFHIDAYVLFVCCNMKDISLVM